MPSKSNKRTTAKKSTASTKAAKPKKAVKTIPSGTEVSWHYRSAIGHGTVAGVAKKGTTSANTKYSIREHDHHPGEPSTVQHYGHALTRKSK